jgi:Zn-dependent peptidase ImmA (M78 family)
LHEFTHILLGESAISNGATEELGMSPEEQRIERFCDTVAAAALMPRGLILSFPQVAPTGARAWSDDDLRTIARSIGVSRHALLIRFVTLKRATWDFYKTQRARFEEENRKSKAAQRASVRQTIRDEIHRPALIHSVP